MTKRSYISLFFIILLIKVGVSLYIYYVTGNQFFGGENDSDYYHQYAVGSRDDAVNIWPVILRWMNEHLYYERGFITLILTILGIVIIPFMVATLALPRKKYRIYFDHKNYWIIALIIALYPSLYYQTTDMYRDIFMLFLFLIYLACIKSWCDRKNIFLLLLALLLCYPLYLFRPYLGAASFLTLAVTPLYSYRRYPLLIIVALYLIALVTLYHYGFLDRITASYRAIFDNMEGGSNLNLRFHDTTSFLPTFLLSWLYQLIGLTFPNLPSIFVFIVESLLFIFMGYYIIKNRKYANKFVSYLIIFFIAYSTVWLLGNDNLGSATRLRIFNYIVVIISFFIIYRHKYIQSCSDLFHGKALT